MSGTKRKWRFRFGISTLLLMTLLLASWLALIVQPVLQRKQAVETLTEAGVLEDRYEPTKFEEPAWSAWQRYVAAWVVESPPWKSRDLKISHDTEIQSVVENASRVGDIVGLDLSSSVVDDDDLKRCVAGKQLQVVSLTMTEVTDQTLETLALLPALKRVDINGTAITQDATNLFRERNPDVIVGHSCWPTQSARKAGRELAASDLKLGFFHGNLRISEPYEGEMPSIDWLKPRLGELSDAKIILDLSLKSVAQLCDLPNLHGIYLSCEKPQMVKLNSVSESLRQLHYSGDLPSLTFILNQFPSELQLDYMSVSNYSYSLEVRSVVDMLKAVSRFRHLGSLVLSMHHEFDGPQLGLLSELPNLARLNLSCPIGDEGFEALATFKKLEFLSFERASFNEDRVVDLQASTSIRFLHFSFRSAPFCGFGDGDFKKCLPRMKTIFDMHQMKQLEGVGWMPDRTLFNVHEEGASWMPDENGLGILDDLDFVHGMWEEIPNADASRLDALAEQYGAGDTERVAACREFLIEFQRFRRSVAGCELMILPYVHMAESQRQKLIDSRE